MGGYASPDTSLRVTPSRTKLVAATYNITPLTQMNSLLALSLGGNLATVYLWYRNSVTNGRTISQYTRYVHRECRDPNKLTPSQRLFFRVGRLYTSV